MFLREEASIENYLTNLKVERVKEDSQIIVYDDPSIIRNRMEQDTTRMLSIKPNNTIVTPGKVYLDSSKRAPAIVKNSTFMIDPLSTQYVMMVLTKVDPFIARKQKMHSPGTMAKIFTIKK